MGGRANMELFLQWEMNISKSIITKPTFYTNTLLLLKTYKDFRVADYDQAPFSKKCLFNNIW